jgi:hypothetical protein
MPVDRGPITSAEGKTVPLEASGRREAQGGNMLQSVINTKRSLCTCVRLQSFITINPPSLVVLGAPLVSLLAPGWLVD